MKTLHDKSRRICSGTIYRAVFMKGLMPWNIQ
jgi:hypothetical protein